MNILLWILAGGLLGLAAYQLVALNEARGKLLSMVIGAVGGVLGGKEVAPIFSTPVVGEFSFTAMLFALGVAALFLGASELLRSRWGV